MEENTLEIKIRKELDFIKEEISSFKRSFNGKELKEKNFIPYLEALNKAFDLNNSYGEDYYEFIEKKNLFFILKNNRELMNDICFKLKNLSLYFQKLNVETKEKPKKNDGICSICQQHIDSQNVQQAKNSVEDVGINKLKRMLKIMEEEGSMAMFSAEEDKHFFQELHRVLTKKEEILSITDNHLEKYLNDIVKNMQEIKYLENLKDTTFSLLSFGYVKYLKFQLMREKQCQERLINELDEDTEKCIIESGINLMRNEMILKEKLD